MFPLGLGQEIATMVDASFSQVARNVHIILTVHNLNCA